MSTEAAAVASIAMTAAHPSRIEVGGTYSLIVPEGGEQVQIDLTGPDYQPAPARKTGIARVHDAASLIAYLGKHGIAGQTEVWADRSRAQLVAVINAPGDADAAWGDHRAELEVRPTPAWQAWTALDGKWLDQSSFAEHIENRAVDIVKPAAASMLEIAQSITATVGVQFKSSKLLSNGERQLEYREDVAASAGKAGRLDIPSAIELGLAPFEGSARYKVVARFRYRIDGGNLRLAFALERPEDVVTGAFDEIVAAVEKDIEHPMYRGNPGTT